MLPGFRNSVPFFFFVEGSRASLLFPSRDSRSMSLMQWWNDTGSKKKMEVLGGKSAPVPLYPQQIPLRC